MTERPAHTRKQMEAAIELARLTARRRVAEARADAQLLEALADQNAQLLAYIDRAAKKVTNDACEMRMRELSDVLQIELQVTDADIVLGEPVA